MKPSARIQSTIDVLDRIKGNTRVPMDSVIGDYMRHRRYIGSKDRANVVERVYHMARHHARLGWWLTRCGVDDAPRLRVLVWLILGEGADEKRLRGLFDGNQYSPAPLSEEELSVVQQCQGFDAVLHEDMPVEIRVECPALYAEKLKAQFGGNFEEEMLALLHPAPLDLRVNRFLTTREKVQESLKADGVESDVTPYSPVGLRCRGKSYLARTKAFRKGWIEIQDEGSQMIANLCEVTPGMQVMDYCAGAGGKTLALAAAMNRKGRIVAMDNDARRLEKGRQRYKKAQLADIIEVRCLEEDKQHKWLKRQKEKFDVVLVDAPCSGTGTWRRNPDMRWTVFGPDLSELLGIQAEILGKAARAVKPGGRLVYATCSLLSDENEDQISAFLAAHTDFMVKPVDAALGDPYMRLSPLRHQTDGFFAAVLEKSNISGV